MDDPGQVMVLPLAMLGPRRKVSKLTVVSIVRHPHLGADKEDFSVMDDNPAIVDDALVNHRPIKTFS